MMLNIQDLTDAVLEYHPTADVDIILDAYIYSAKAHRNQSRKSGEAYISHPMEVAYNLTRLKMDEETVAAGLLHDTIEDTLSTSEEIQEMFGEEVFRLVDGVTKISQIQFSSKEESQAENYRKMILAMSHDIRVVLIKLADRAHNILTLGAMSKEGQQRIARETLEIYAPLANRLGIGWLKTELENGAFKYLYPDEFADIQEKLARGQEQRDIYVEKVCLLLDQELKEEGIPGTVVGRPKHYYSIFKKMKAQDLEFDEVYDLTGVRVLINDLKDCYSVLGLVHAIWKPISSKFKDYIALPKPNMYQSLHTTVIGPEGERVEVQIRTREMHSVCEEGIAAHWRYKETGEKKKKDKMEQPLLWVRHLIESQKDLKNPKEFLNSFKVNLFPHEVYVFTPTGDVVSLPYGATAVDFAFDVHTDIGSHCHTAKVNGKIVPLRYKLRNGDQVEIQTSKQKTPSRDWLAFVKTSKARSKISHFINAREREQCLSLGRGLLEKEVRHFGVSPAEFFKTKRMAEAAQACGFNSLDSLLTAIGFGKVSVRHVVEKAFPKEVLAERKTKQAVGVEKETTPPERREGAIRIKNIADDILLRLGKCCLPVPGDPITGYITRGRGVTVHHVDCATVKDMGNESERLIEVEWNDYKKQIYPVQISIVTEDKPGLLANISSVLATCDINIARANVRQGSHKRAYFDLSIEVQDLVHLTQTLDQVKKVDGVIFLERVNEYNKKISVNGPQKKGGGKTPAPADRGLITH